MLLTLTFITYFTQLVTAVVQKQISKQIVSHRIFTQVVHFRQCFALFSNLTVKIKTPTGLHFRIAQEIVYNLEIFKRMEGRYNIRTPSAFRIAQSALEVPYGKFQSCKNRNL